MGRARGGGGKEGRCRQRTRRRLPGARPGVGGSGMGIAGRDADGGGSGDEGDGVER